MNPDDIGEMFVVACFAELQALKPGNVHIHASGHGMTVADFEASAAVAAPHIAAEGAKVGERILGAVRATREAVGQNTNLGIVLLAAPLALAAEGESGSLRERLDAVLAALDREDAALCYQAIALANPGGLGDAAEHDVRAPAAIGLREAMRLAAGRDRVAYQYASGYADIFDTGLPTVCGFGTFAEIAQAAEDIFWRFLTTIPDSHIARKYGADRAKAVLGMALATDAALEGAADAAVRHALLLDFDARLKAGGLNPGTTADLTVATLFAHALM
jgi:triphosphoribosyl-dephospho-CoA synthase